MSWLVRPGDGPVYDLGRPKIRFILQLGKDAEVQQGAAIIAPGLRRW